MKESMKESQSIIIYQQLQNVHLYTIKHASMSDQFKSIDYLNMQYNFGGFGTPHLRRQKYCVVILPEKLFSISMILVRTKNLNETLVIRTEFITISIKCDRC